MLLRACDDGVIAITQPAHAWLAGALARHWGASGFNVPDPCEEVILATSLHDIGWLGWERRPVLDPATGWPQLFCDVAAEEHMQLWRGGIADVAAYGLYPALLVSRHGDAIYERDLSPSHPTPAPVRAFLAEQAERQAAFLRDLGASPRLQTALSPAGLATSKRFVAALDALSLNLCWGVRDGHPVTIHDVPTREGTVTDLRLISEAGQVTVTPWPFTVEAVVLNVPGRRLLRRSRTQAELDASLAEARTADIVIALALAG